MSAVIASAERPSRRPNDPLPEALTVEQVAEVLHVSERSVRKAIRSGQMPGRKFGKSYIIDRVVFESWLANS